MSTEQTKIDLRDLKGQGQVEALHNARRTLFQCIAELEEENAELRARIRRLEVQAGDVDE